MRADGGHPTAPSQKDRPEALVPHSPVSTLENLERESIPVHWSEEAVFFDGTASVDLSVPAQRSLEHLAHQLRAHPEYDVLLRGHADSRGEPRLNLSLSRARAKAVATYLERQGIASRRIGTQALGASRPVIGRDGRESIDESRRVEIVLLKGE